MLARRDGDIRKCVLVRKGRLRARACLSEHASSCVREGVPVLARRVGDAEPEMLAVCAVLNPAVCAGKIQYREGV